MNKTSGLVATPLFKEDAGSVPLTKIEAVSPKPAPVNMSILEFVPGNPQPLGNTPCLYRTQADPIPGAAHATTETGDEGLPLLIAALATL
jgi:hypothetical protein